MMARPKTIGRVVPLAEKKTAGAPRKVAPPDAASVIRKATTTGASKVGVAMALACSVTVLDRWLDEDPALAEAFAHGRERERQTLHSVLYEAATNGNLIAAMFLLKARHGYREGDTGDQANRVSINFSLPGAMSLKDFGVIENAADNSDQRLPTKSITLTRGS